jgi:hypothetical protein
MHREALGLMQIRPGTCMELGARAQNPRLWEAIYELDRWGFVKKIRQRECKVSGRTAWVYGPADDGVWIETVEDDRLT